MVTTTHDVRGAYCDTPPSLVPHGVANATGRSSESYLCLGLRIVPMRYAPQRLNLYWYSERQYSSTFVT